MRISKRQIKKLNPCSDGWDWYLKNGTSDLKETLLLVNKYKPEWARWLYTHLMTPTQNRRIAIYAAVQVLPIFEAAYPKDNRPRLAIVAAKAVLATVTLETLSASAAAAAAAASASVYASASASVYAANAANAAYYASASAAAAYAAAAYASAAAYYASAANAAYYASVNTETSKMQRKLIRRAVRILEGK